MDELRTRADAVVVGAGTVRHDGWPMLIRYDDLIQRRVARKRSRHPVNVVLSTELDLPIRARFFQSGDAERILYTTRRAPAARVKRFRTVADVVVLPGRRLAPAAVVKDLRARGLRNILVEGGGETHFAFASAGLVDKLYVTVTPRLIGGAGAPTLLDGKGFLKRDHLKLALESMRRRGDEVFLRYRVLGAHPDKRG
jgi:5-amino-6-(5-phosphoribosylamino)uracil reductase